MIRRSGKSKEKTKKRILEGEREVEEGMRE